MDDRDSKDKQARQLEQQRRLVECGVLEPELIPAIQPSHREQEEGERHGNGRHHGPSTNAESTENDKERGRDRGDIRDREQRGWIGLFDSSASGADASSLRGMTLALGPPLAGAMERRAG